MRTWEKLLAVAGMIVITVIALALYEILVSDQLGRTGRVLSGVVFGMILYQSVTRLGKT